MLRLTIILSLLILCFILGISFLIFFNAIKPHRYISHITPEKLNLSYENIRLTTSDNLSLSAYYIPASIKTDKTIIVCHGYPADKNDILGATFFLAEKFNLFLFDFRNLGYSEGTFCSFGYNERKDLLAAVKWIKNNHPGPIGAYGFSVGGSTILMTDCPDIKAVVADSSFASATNLIKRQFAIFPGIMKKPFVWLMKFYVKIFLNININDISPKNKIAEKNIPILLIHGSSDRLISVENAYILYESSNKKTTDLWIIDNAGHGTSFHVAGEKYIKKITHFFESNL